jgi:hypothetical protein
MPKATRDRSPNPTTTEVATASPASVSARPAASEAGGLAREMSDAYRGMVAFYRDRLRESPDQALARADALDWADLDHLRRPDDLSWFTLGRVTDADPQRGAAVWTAVKEEARAELDSGHRAARVLEWEGSPWQRAQYLAVRQAFRDEWQPRGSIEDALVDMLAQAYTSYLHWMRMLTVRQTVEAKRMDHTLEKSHQWEPPRVAEDAAVEQAFQMVDRFNRLFLRTLRSLRDLRRYSGPVVIQGAGQVNLGAQQVNITRPATG